MSENLNMKYAEALSEKTSLEFKIRNLNRLVEDLKLEAKAEDKIGCGGLDITAHASKQILKRLETLSAESTIIYNDVMNLDNPSASLIWPSNMESFIIGIMAKAKEDGGYTVEDSKNSSGKEYRYNIEIKHWSIDNKKLIFTGVVEGNNIKTGFFNWVQ